MEKPPESEFKFTCFYLLSKHWQQEKHLAQQVLMACADDGAEIDTCLLFLLQAGYYCNVCECILRDSQSYLDHINGKYHNRALGMSMTVEKSTADDVRKKFEELKKDKDQPMPVDSVLDGMCLLLAFSMSTQQNIKVHFNKICSPTKQEPS